MASAKIIQIDRESLMSFSHHLLCFNALWFIADEEIEEDHVLDWILEIHHGNTMKNVSRQSLMNMVDNYDFLAVVFCKSFIYLNLEWIILLNYSLDTVGEEESERVLRRVEMIDEEVAQYGVLLVKCDDYLMAKKYGHRSTPALVYFRHGKLLHFEGTHFFCKDYMILRSWSMFMNDFFYRRFDGWRGSSRLAHRSR